MSKVAFCVLLAFAASPLAAHATGQSAVGDWSGALHRGDAAYRVRFHVQATPDGRLTGTVSGLPGDDYAPVPAAVEASSDTLLIAVGAARYSGVWDQTAGAWVGSWKQADLSEPLALRLDADEGIRPTRLHKPMVVTVPARPSAPPTH